MSLHFRLAIWFIVIVLVSGAVLAVVTVDHIGNVLIAEVRNRVRLDLSAASTIYAEELEGIELALRTAALDVSLSSSLPGGGDALQGRLEGLRAVAEMDTVCVTDPRGRVLACETQRRPLGKDFSDNAVVRAAIRSGKVARGTVIVPTASELASIGVTAASSPLSRPAGGSLVAATHPTDSMEAHQWMAAAAAVPLRTGDGRIAGVLYGAKILNGRHELVDRIRDQVFQKRTQAGQEIGTATLFQGDVRIATNVMTQDGRRAVDTRMSAEVARAVLEQGETYNAPAFVVNDWYITAYEPIRDPDGTIIGSLYVGLLQAPFKQMRGTIVWGFLLAMAGATVLIVLLLMVVTRHVLRPIERIVSMSKRVSGGDLSARVGVRPAGELGQLCAAVDAMADAVQQREEQLKLATRRQLGQSEKLASVGRLAAGIAHEVNNPLTGVLTFTHLLRGKANLDDQDREDLDLVIRETTRVRDIVRGLLDFARESPSRKAWIDVNGVIQQATRLLRGQKEFRQVRIEERLDANVPALYGDANQLQQLVLNLSLNACEAMAGGGTLVIETKRGDSGVVLAFRDTGHGIPAEDLDKIFEPFFTTKPVGKGTGLGLSVSYGIVQQHGGTIDVESAPGAGTTFTVTLPIGGPEAKE